MRNWRAFGRRLGARAKSAARSATEPLARLIVTFILKAVRRADRLWVSDVFARITRAIGPWLPEHRLGRANLTAAFPEKSADEIERILMGVWDNLGRVTAEFAHLDRLAVGDPFNLPYLRFDV